MLRELNGAGVTDEEIHKITWENACRFFVRSVRHIPKEQATVGALRALSPDVDTTIRSRHEWAKRYEASAVG